MPEARLVRPVRSRRVAAEFVHSFPFPAASDVAVVAALVVAASVVVSQDFVALLRSIGT